MMVQSGSTTTGIYARYFVFEVQNIVDTLTDASAQQFAICIFVLKIPYTTHTQCTHIIDLIRSMPFRVRVLSPTKWNGTCQAAQESSASKRTNFSFH